MYSKILLLILILTPKCNSECTEQPPFNIDCYKQRHMCGTSTRIGADSCQESFSERTRHRFGCCPDGWELYHETEVTKTGPGGTDETNRIKAEFCDPSLPISVGGVNCGVTAARYGLDDTICQGVPFIINPPTVSPVSACPECVEVKGRCRNKNEMTLKNTVNKFKNLKFNDRTTFKNLFGITAGKPCSSAMYNARNIGKLWDRFLLCPFDEKFLTMEFNKILEETYFSPDHLKLLCLESHSMLECVDDKCQCLKRVHKPEGATNPIWEFDQKQESHHCGVKAGSICAFNVKDLRNNHAFYSSCDIKGDAIKGMTLLPVLACEVNAGCDNQLHPGTDCIKTNCTCVCSEGHTCDAGNINYLSRIPLILSLIIKLF